MELAFLPATEQARLVREREVTPLELVELYLERIERLDPELGAYVTVCGEEALAEARAKTDAPAEAPFHGVPISLKDLDTTAGIRTTFSSPAFAANVPDFDLAHVTKLRAAGFVILGKTNTPEFGTTAFTDSALNGPCRTPWDLSRNAGGSSGGAGSRARGRPVRDRAGLGRRRLDPDPRRRAAACSASRPRAAASRTRRSPRGSGSARPGRSPARPPTPPPTSTSSAATSGATRSRRRRPSGRTRTRSASTRAGCASALTTVSPNDAQVDDACVAAARDAAELLASLGHDVEEAAPEWGGAELMEDFRPVWQVAPSLYPVRDPSVLSPLNQAFLRGCRRDAERGLRRRRLTRLQLRARKIASFWSSYDLLLTPTLALPPVPVGWETEPEDPWEQFDRAVAFTPFTAAFNVTGQPAVSLPLHWTDAGLPIGVQLVGPPLGDALLFRVASQLEEARPWADRRPPHS